MDVISEPAYVVGTARIGSPVSSATAFAMPVDDPPPSAMITSTPHSLASAIACCATGTGTCITTSVNRATMRSPS
ncbi:unannotated protein [freshwater metagenome]|uniref:Unannotated protein n=1 Tax=freshwater metagenome TaxID=449393 RepID=A0A6J6UH43_9ZZZZ